MSSAYTELGVAIDPQDAKAEMEDDLATRIPGWTSVPGSLTDNLLEVAALQIARIGAALEEAALDAFVAYGTDIVREPMLVEEHAAGVVTFTASHTDGVGIPIGTVLIGSDGAGGEVVMHTIANATIPSGDTTVTGVPVESVDPGLLANPLTGTATLSSGIEGITSVAFDEDTSIGADGETREEYADRLAEKLELLSASPVTPDDYDVFLRSSLTAVDRVLVREGFYPGENEIQTISTTGTPSAGTFTLTYSGQTTGAIAYDASAATIQTALEALSNIAPGDVALTGGPLPATPVVVEFTGTLQRTDVATITVTDSVTGGDAVVTATQAGRADAEGTAGMLTVSMIDSSGAHVGAGVDADAAVLIAANREANDTIHIVAPTITPIDVTYTIILDDGYDEATVVATCDAALQAFLDPANWGQPRTGDTPAWVLKQSVRPVGMLGPVIGACEGVESVESVTARKGVDAYATTTITLPGDAPLTSAGTMTGSEV